MLVSNKDNLIIEFNEKTISFDDDDFRCYFFELTNRCNAISTGVLRFFGGQIKERDISLLSDGHPFIGSKAVVKYSEAVHSSRVLFSGYVSSVSSSNDGGITCIEFMLSSPEFWLISGRNIISWEEPKTYKEILDEIFSKYNPKLGKYHIDFNYDLPSSLILVHNGEENDYEYIKKIANQTGSLFYSVDGAVKFRPIEFDRSYSLQFDGKLGKSNFIKEVKLTSNLIGIPKAVSVSYIKDDDHDNLISVSEQLSGQIGEGSQANSITPNIDESTSLNFINLNVDSNQTAKYLAQAEHKRRSLNFITCELTCDLTAKFKVGSNMILTNFNSIVDNEYILTSITYKFENTDEGAELTTKMVLNTDAVKLNNNFGHLW